MNAPSTFQKLMNKLFWPYLQKFNLVVFDDILLYSKTWDEHIQHLDLVLQLLCDHHLHAKQSKCVFGKKEVENLGHIVLAQGVHINPFL